MKDINKYIELVYLFVDGEATDSEKAILFDVMSNSEELQKELQSALLMKQSIEEEVADLTLSDNLENNLMANAGFEAKPKAIEKASKKAPLLAFLLKFLKPSILILSGIIIGYFLFNNDNGNNLAEELSSQSTGEEVLSNDNKQNTVEKKKIQSSVIPEKLASNNEVKKRRYAQYSDDNIVSKTTIPIKSILDKDNSTNNIINIDYSNDQKKFISEYALENLRRKSNYKKMSSPADFLEVSNISNKKHFSFSVNGIQNIAHFPERNIDKNLAPDFDNLSFELGYYLTDNFLLGLSAGQETFPIYIQEADKLKYHTSIIWYGLNLRYNGDYLFTSDINPYYNFAAAYTVSGPFIKLGTGLSWQLNSFTKMNFGLEASSIFIQYKKEGERGSKLSFKYGIEFDL